MGADVRIVYSSDLHGSIGHYRALRDLAERERADAVVLGGDLLPTGAGFHAILADQQRFVRDDLPDLLAEFQQLGPVYLMPGNADWASAFHLVGDLESQGQVHLIDGRIQELPGGCQIIGYSRVPPTPLAIKDFERRDLPRDEGRSAAYRAFVSNGTAFHLVEEEAHFGALGSIEEELAALPRPRDPARTLYVMHSPPHATSLDVLHDGSFVGSRAIRRFIEREQPLLTLHGHIHESPRMSGTYRDQLGATLSLNAGQSFQALHALVFEAEDPAGTVRHTLLGRGTGR